MRKDEQIVELRPATIACTVAVSALCLVTLAGVWISPVLSAVTTTIIQFDDMFLSIMARISGICILLIVYNAAFWLDLYFIAVSRIALIFAGLGIANLYFTVYPFLSPDAMPYVYLLLCFRIAFMALLYLNLRFALQRRRIKRSEQACLFNGQLAAVSPRTGDRSEAQ